jgi:hypothetical protein
MTRSDTRSDDIRNSNLGAASRTSVGRHLPSGEVLKRDARQFLNTAEYEFRKVVGASRTAPRPQEPDQAPARETAARSKPEAPNPENDQG